MDNQFFAPAFNGTNFGTTEYSKLIEEGLMKVACGYWNGYTLQTILNLLGYTEQVGNAHHWVLTHKGQEILYKFYEKRER